ncbi:MAG: methylmalonyl Co-A mutase-associated GTPase MeaB [Bacteroidia bacterium]|nr:methylmalonyl Co-A mutase-associated GTPase MeaB [Bacteroidia bacterium]
MRKRLTTREYADGILAGQRGILSKAITLVESTLPADRDLAEEVLSLTLRHAGKSIRLGLTGVPGVGKSTFIDAFGTWLTQNGEKVAVLAVDPSSQLSRGSILGDKTRMERLSRDENAFIRPSPAGGSLGGVTRTTRETIQLCEAFGFGVILVETVGVGQSEIAVHSMVDFFMLLMLPGAGDELQGIKKGIMEMADAILINKADGPNLEKARLARAQYANAVRLFPARPGGWRPKVAVCSALEETGMQDAWEMVRDFREMHGKDGFASLRSAQNLEWLHETIRWMLEDAFFGNSHMKNGLLEMETKVREGKLPPTVAARKLVSSYFQGKS